MSIFSFVFLHIAAVFFLYRSGSLRARSGVKMKRHGSIVKSKVLIMCTGCLLFAAIAAALYTGYIVNSTVAGNDIHATAVILRTERLFREKAAAVHIPYGGTNPGEIPEKAGTFRHMTDLDPGVQIVSVANLVDSERKIRGITVQWKLHGAVFHTNCLYTTAPADWSR